MGKSTAIRDFFTAREAAELSGLSTNMVDYLCREKIVEPTYKAARGYGVQRRYTFGDVTILRAIGQMLREGVTVRKMRRAMKRLRKYHSDITPISLPANYLATDGREVLLHRGSDVLENVVTGQLSFAFVVELKRVHAEVLSMVEFEQHQGTLPSFSYRMRTRGASR